MPQTFFIENIASTNLSDEVDVSVSGQVVEELYYNRELRVDDETNQKEKEWG